MKPAQRLFFHTLNLDDDPSQVKEGQYIQAENVQVEIPVGSKRKAVAPMKGNIEIF